MIRNILTARIKAEFDNISSREVLDLVDSFWGVVGYNLKKRNRIEIRGFGVFSPKRLVARKIKNPISGKIISVPTRNSINFKTSPELVKKLSSKEGLS
ncbi:MAG: HU family DNA-binding protein [Alphaproteobacteria bacterium]|nr:HU family DNA-binding protein [Alphaproteobacteria bacterium]MBL0718039.1 HU family DNA-binding protein [Alphaproteobacteria bacterium]